MKAVLISIKPKYVELIASGEKTIEVRKTRPKIETPFKCYIYATKSGDRIVLKNDRVWEISKELTGKVMGEFMCRGMMDGSSKLMPKQSCLTLDELMDYAKGKRLYGWRIADLVIYDKPKELSEFAKAYPIKCGKVYESIDCTGCGSEFTCSKRFITRPPQSWCYVEEYENEQATEL